MSLGQEHDIQIGQHFTLFRQGTDIPVELILFRENGSYADSGTGLRYTNAFDMGVDAFVSAIKSAGYPDMEVIVGEAGKITSFLLKSVAGSFRSRPSPHSMMDSASVHHVRVFSKMYYETVSA